MSWFYNSKLSRWFHAEGVASDNAADNMPSEAETQRLIASKPQAEAKPRSETTPQNMPPPGDCGCNKGGQRATR